MDTQNSQVPSMALHGNTDVPDYFQAGEFAEPSLVSPVATPETASIGSLVRITKDYRLHLVGQFGIIATVPLGIADAYEIQFLFGHDDYSFSEFELVFPSSSLSKDLQTHLVGHLNALLDVSGVDAANIPLLFFVAAKLHDVILLDADGAKRLDIELSLFNACQLLRFGFEDLTNGSKFGRRVSGVFMDAAFEKLKRAAVILNVEPSFHDYQDYNENIKVGSCSHCASPRWAGDTECHNCRYEYEVVV